MDKDYLSVEPGLLRFPSQVVEGGAPIPVAGVLEGDEVFKTNPTVCADLVECQFSGFKELDKVRTGDSEDIGRSLGGQFLSLGNQRDDFALLHGRGHADEQIIDRPGQFGAVAVFIDQCRWIRFAPKKIQQVANRFSLSRRELRGIKTGGEAGWESRSHGYNRNNRNIRTKRNKDFPVNFL